MLPAESKFPELQGTDIRHHEINILSENNLSFNGFLTIQCSAFIQEMKVTSQPLDFFRR